MAARSPDPPFAPERWVDVEEYRTRRVETVVAACQKRGSGSSARARTVRDSVPGTFDGSSSELRAGMPPKLLRRRIRDCKVVKRLELSEVGDDFWAAAMGGLNASSDPCGVCPKPSPRCSPVSRNWPSSHKRNRPSLSQSVPSSRSTRATSRKTSTRCWPLKSDDSRLPDFRASPGDQVPGRQNRTVLFRHRDLPAGRSSDGDRLIAEAAQRAVVSSRRLRQKLYD